MGRIGMKFYSFFLGSILLGVASTAMAQNAFWNFDDFGRPVTIAPECDAQFNEVRGGVFMPTTAELYEHGMRFLGDPDPEIQRQASYCLLLAAMDGNVSAQLTMARLYNKGVLVPQDDLNAYRWAFIAALEGNKEAETFVLTLEQFLTTRDLEIVSPQIQVTMLQIKNRTSDEAKKQEADLAELRKELAAAEMEVGRMRGLDVEIDDAPEFEYEAEDVSHSDLHALSPGSLFSEADRF